MSLPRNWWPIMDRNAAPEQKGSPQFRVLRAGPQAFKLPREKIMIETSKSISLTVGHAFADREYASGT